jgi:NADPH:quinone reductase-like Zn-dependent oxidoreductase
MYLFSLIIKASTVSITDCLLRRGVSFDMFAQDELPATPGCDVVGYIVKLGPKATSHMNDFTYGDRVAALVRTGGNARYISVSASDLVRVPRSCDSVEAACMVSIFSTAYTSLKEISIDTPTFSLEGKKVLVVGGMDPVGQALIQMLIKARADPVFVTAPEYHHPYIRSVLGAYPLPEKAVEWTPYVNEKMDFVFDGECEDSMKASRSALAPDGHLVCFGTRSVLKEKEVSAFGAPLYAIYNKWNAESKPKTTTIDIWDGFQKDRVTAKVRFVSFRFTSRGCMPCHAMDHANKMTRAICLSSHPQRHLTALFQLLKGKKIKPRIACRISLAEVADAQAKLENGEFNGAVVCLPWKRTPPRPEENSRDRNPVGRNVGGW